MISIVGGRKLRPGPCRTVHHLLDPKCYLPGILQPSVPVLTVFTNHDDTRYSLSPYIQNRTKYFVCSNNTTFEIIVRCRCVIPWVYTAVQQYDAGASRTH